MIFEYDEEKSAANLQKHGISFMLAEELWEDEYMVILPSHRQNEERWLCIAEMRDKFWTAIITYRENKTRIISVRRARNKEISIYEAFRNR
jgi:uncharacterized DUF497 family protein